MEKLIVVAYVGIKQFMDNNASDYLEKISELLRGKRLKDDDTLFLVVPRRDTTEITIDCINPKLLDAEQYKKVEESVEKLKEAVDTLFKKGED